MGMVPDEGIEPPTFGLQNRCSTAELIRRFQSGFALSASRPTRKGAFQPKPAGTVGAQRPATGWASSIPGHGGMVIATNRPGFYEAQDAALAGTGGGVARAVARDGCGEHIKCV